MPASAFPHVPVWRMALAAALVGGVAVLMLVFEIVKQRVHPDITIWESHIITVIFSSLIAGALGYLILRLRDEMYAGILTGSNERVQAAAEIERVNSLLRATLESTNDAIVVASLDAQVTAYNRRFLDLWRLPESLVLSSPAEAVRQILAQLEDPDRWTENFARLQKDTEAWSTDTLVLKDGRILERLSAPQRLGEHTVGRVWTYRDVTAQHRALQQIQMLAHTVRSIGVCVCVTDMADRFLFVNQAFLDTYGFEEAELIGHSITIVRSPKNREEDVSEILPATRRGGWQGEVWNRRKDGTDFQISLSTSVVRDEAGGPVALVGIAQDITERKRTDEALRRGRESEAIVTLAGGIAHEFNNQLQAVLGHAALALSDLPPHTEVHESLQAIVHAGERVANLTGQLLAYSGRATFLAEELDLNGTISRRTASFRALLPPGATLELDLAPSARPIRIDAGQLQQVLTSLVTNAAEAMVGRSGRITVRSRGEDVGPSDPRRWITAGGLAPGAYVCLVVEDEGCGMDEQTLARIFDPFFTTKFLGRGMGLPAVLGVARAVGGSVAVESVRDRGTRVVIAFPAEPTVGPSSPSPADTDIRSPGSGPSQST